MTTRKRYSQEFKRDAISLVKEQGYSRVEAAKSLSILQGKPGAFVSIQLLDTESAKALQARLYTAGIKNLGMKGMARTFRIIGGSETSYTPETYGIDLTKDEYMPKEIKKTQRLPFSQSKVA